MRRKQHQGDYVLLILVGIVVVFGLMMLISVGSVIGYEKFSDGYHFFKRQFLFGLLPGLLGFFLFSRTNYWELRKTSFALMIASIVLLLLVFIPGLRSEFGNARSWISFGEFSIQPSEIVKLTFLVYLAGWLDKTGEKDLSDVSQGLMPFLVVLGVIMILIGLQPDFGTMSIIIGMSMVVYFVGGGKISHLLGLSGLGAVLGFIAVKMAPYRLARFTSFLNPELDPQGIGYHIKQALLAVGSGGWFGLGLGHSHQKFSYLPEVVSDSIFAVIAEELGFVFSGLLIILFIFLMWRALNIAKNAPDTFGRLLAVGIIAWIFLQTIVNIGAMLALLPITGVPLPFISHGGTALMVSLTSMGILYNISKFTKE